MKVNEVAVIRTTGEKVFVLAIDDREAQVLRPVQGEGGCINHNVERFPVTVLAEPIEYLVSEHTEMKAFQERVMSMSAKKDAPKELLS